MEIVNWQRERRSRFQCYSCGVPIKEINVRTGLPYSLCSEHRVINPPGTKNKTMINRRRDGVCVGCAGEVGLNPNTNKPKARCLKCNQRQEKMRIIREDKKYV